MPKRFLCSVLATFVALGTKAQKAEYFLLDKIIKIAQSQSPRYKLAQTQKEVKKYEYLSFRSNRKPQISIYGNAPVYGKQFTSVIQPDGSIQYLPVQQNTNNIGFSLSQALPFSGGQISLNTELNHFYNFQDKYSQYNGTPVFLQLNQPLFGYNDLKWQKEIEPLKFEESIREYIQEMESIAQQVIKLYFNVLDAQNNIAINEMNLANTNSNYEIEKQRVQLGTTTEDKLLQLQLQVLRNRQELEKAKYDYKIAALDLRTFIGSKENNDFELILPENIPDLHVSLEKAIECAKLYRPEYVTFERKKKEAQRDVAQAKADKQRVNITASYGLNRASDRLPVIYNDPKSQQTFSIGFNVPIIDWGRRNARYNTNKALEKLVDFNNELGDAGIVQEITTLVNNIDLLKLNIELAKLTDSVAQHRYAIANNLYQIGKLTVTDLNIAQAEKDNAKKSYILSLRDYWNSYYLLRRLTLYDFEKQTQLYKK
jgi:outer membrane protein